MLAKMLHGGLEGKGHIAGLHVSLIKGLHEIGSASVVDIPEGEKEGRRASAEEAALEAKELVTSGDEVHACGTAAKRNVAGGKAHLIEVVEV